MRADVAESIDEFPAADWNRLAGRRYPFLRHEFLHAAESTGCVSPETGWQPRHIGLRDTGGRLIAAMPLYEKSHSWGEFVFDWSWAHAYERAGFDYYPKLVSAVPFTPAPSRRLLSASPDHSAALVEAACELSTRHGYSSLHVLFPEKSELDLLEGAGLKLRRDCQFHWHNQGYANFDEFLATFSSSKRKKVRRDRRHVTEQGIRCRRLRGSEADSAVWKDVYQLISITFLRRGSLPYYNQAFFEELSERLPDSVMIVMAEKNRMPIAAAVFYDTADTLYGRYWGADADYNALHFETCYYQGIEHCIDTGRQLFEPGTQGEHKISRGFVPVDTWSAHWLARPEFFTAVGQFLEAEGRHVERYVDAVNLAQPLQDTATDMKSPQITWISASDPPEAFPDVERAFDIPDGLLAAGGDLSEPRLLYAYSHGIFPWFSEGQPILWWSPDPRCVIRPEALRISRRLARAFRNSSFEISFNRVFDDVISRCAADRPGQDGTWITPAMHAAYRQLHAGGWAHSVEVWRDEQLVGGLYGLAIGRVFFGESMFSADTNASKAAMHALCRVLIDNDFVLLDCQVESPHLLSMGAELMPRARFIEIVEASCAGSKPFTGWPLQRCRLGEFAA